jgi:hypothetical protein
MFAGLGALWGSTALALTAAPLTLSTAEVGLFGLVPVGDLGVREVLADETGDLGLLGGESSGAVERASRDGLADARNSRAVRSVNASAPIVANIS